MPQGTGQRQGINNFLKVLQAACSKAKGKTGNPYPSSASSVPGTQLLLPCWTDTAPGCVLSGRSLQTLLPLSDVFTEKQVMWRSADLLTRCLMMNSFCLFSNAAEQRLTTSTARRELPQLRSLFPVRSWGKEDSRDGYCQLVWQHHVASIHSLLEVCMHAGLCGIWPGHGAYAALTDWPEQGRDKPRPPGWEDGKRTEKCRKPQRRKTRICNSNPFIPEGLVKQLLVIALVHFNTLTVPQLLVTAPSAGVWSTDHFLLLLCNKKSDRIPQEAWVNKV